MRRYLISFILIVFAIAGSFWLVQSRQREPVGQSQTEATSKEGTRVGNLAPDFEVYDYEGNLIRFSDFRGDKPVFLNFWASWCPFCLDEMPIMAQVQQEFGDQYVTLAINRAEKLDRARQFSDQVGVTGKILLALDEDDFVYRGFGYFAMPTSIFIGKDGIIKAVKQGPLQAEELRLNINAILQ